MTDLEISKQLALAIGWAERQIVWSTPSGGAVIELDRDTNLRKVFDYRDWNVIGPIAERYEVFPYKTVSMGWASNCNYADAPQKAIALAVIGAKK